MPRSSRKRPRPLLVVGAGGFAREAAQAVRVVNAHRPVWRPLGFLDDDPSRHGAVVDGLPVLGPVDAVHDWPDAAVLICTGRPDNYVSRPLLAARMELDDDRFATVVHPGATVGHSCRVGPGSVLLAHVDLTADVVVGRHVAVMPQVVLTHDVIVEDFATLGSGVRIGGGSRIATGAYVGAGALIREGVVVGERAMVGMGSVVTRSVPAERQWLGSPARDVAPAPLPTLRPSSAS